MTLFAANCVVLSYLMFFTEKPLEKATGESRWREPQLKSAYQKSSKTHWKCTKTTQRRAPPCCLYLVPDMLIGFISYCLTVPLSGGSLQQLSS